MGDQGSWKGIPRDRIPWHPTVDAGKCVGCRSCFDFCSHGVYSWDEAAGIPVVANPSNCVVGCSNCSHQCKEEAISFPPLSVLTDLLGGKR
jgi:NAD-dependent dihydropyrimidine dehydrogenase PreA subunit